MKSNKTLLPDMLAALVIIIGLFYMMIATVETVYGADFRPAGVPGCMHMHQKTTKEVLSCD